MCTIATATVCCILILIEATCYVLLFLHIYHHDNQVVISVLKPDVIKQRNKKNAISFAGQLCTWILEALYTTLLTYFVGWKNNATIRETASFVKLSEFTLVPLVQILCSPPLRNFALKLKEI